MDNSRQRTTSRAFLRRSAPSTPNVPVVRTFFIARGAGVLGGPSRRSLGADAARDCSLTRPGTVVHPPGSFGPSATAMAFHGKDMTEARRSFIQAQVGDELTVKGHHQSDQNHHGEIIDVIRRTERRRTSSADERFESLFFIRPRPDRPPPDRRAGHKGTRYSSIIHRVMGRKRPRARQSSSRWPSPQPPTPGPAHRERRPGHDQHRPDRHVQTGSATFVATGRLTRRPQRFLRAVGRGHDQLC